MQDPTPIEITVDADAWQIWGQNEIYILCFSASLPPLPPCLKTSQCHYTVLYKCQTILQHQETKTRKLNFALNFYGFSYQF